MSVSALRSSGAPMKLAIGVPLAALIRNATICVADRPSAGEELRAAHRQRGPLGPQGQHRLRDRLAGIAAIG